MDSEDIFGLCSGCNVPYLFLNLTRGHKPPGSAALSKHVIHYGTVSGFMYYILTAPFRDGSLYPPLGDALSISVGLSPNNLYHYSAYYRRKRGCYQKRQLDSLLYNFSSVNLTHISRCCYNLIYNTCNCIYTCAFQ